MVWRALISGSVSAVAALVLSSVGDVCLIAPALAHGMYSGACQAIGLSGAAIAPYLVVGAGIAYGLAGTVTGLTLGRRDVVRRRPLLVAGFVGGAAAGVVWYVGFIGRPLMWWAEDGAAIMEPVYHLMVSVLGTLLFAIAIALACLQHGIWRVLYRSLACSLASVTTFTIFRLLVPFAPVGVAGVSLYLLVHGLNFSAFTLGVMTALPPTSQRQHGA